MWRSYCGLISLMVMTVSYASTIDVYVDCHQVNALNLSNDTPIIHRIHCEKVLDEHLNAKLKGHSQRDQAIIVRHWEQAHLGDYIKAFNDDRNAVLSGVKKVPAIVIDHHYVIYGIKNVTQACAIFKQFLSNQAGSGT